MPSSLLPGVPQTPISLPGAPLSPQLPSLLPEAPPSPSKGSPSPQNGPRPPGLRTRMRPKARCSSRVRCAASSGGSRWSSSREVLRLGAAGLRWVSCRRHCCRGLAPGWEGKGGQACGEHTAPVCTCVPGTCFPSPRGPSAPPLLVQAHNCALVCALVCTTAHTDRAGACACIRAHASTCSCTHTPASTQACVSLCMCKCMQALLRPQQGRGLGKDLQ